MPKKINNVNSAICYLVGIATAEDFQLPKGRYFEPCALPTPTGVVDCALQDHTSLLCEPIIENVNVNAHFMEQTHAKKEGDLIEYFKRLPHNWDSLGGGPISDVAVKNAQAALSELSNHGICPDRISPTPDDSVLFEMSSETESWLMEFFGTGDVAAVRNSGEAETLFDSTNVCDAVAFIANSSLVVV